MQPRRFKVNKKVSFYFSNSKRETESDYHYLVMACTTEISILYENFVNSLTKLTTHSSVIYKMLTVNIFHIFFSTIAANDAIIYIHMIHMLPAHLIHFYSVYLYSTKLQQQSLYSLSRVEWLWCTAYIFNSFKKQELDAQHPSPMHTGIQKDHICPSVSCTLSRHFL